MNKTAVLFFVLLLTDCSFEKQTASIESGKDIDAAFVNLPEIDFTYLSIIQGVKYSMPVNNYFFKRSGDMPEFLMTLSDNLNGSLNNFQTAFSLSFQLLSSSAGGYGPPVPSSFNRPEITTKEEIDQCIEANNFILNKKEEWDKLPFEMRKCIIENLISINDARKIFEYFSKEIQEQLPANLPDTRRDLFDILFLPMSHRELRDLSGFGILQKADLKKLSFATRVLTEKLNSFFSIDISLIPESFSGCSFNTILGEVAINSLKNDTIRGNEFMIIEPGGDDIYYGNLASSVSNDQPFGIIVDFEGDDKYLSDNHFLAAGILGIGLLIDLGGNDLYRTDVPGLAFSLYGSSLLYDLSGDDIYISKGNYCQAASFFGSSFLIDIRGDDKYNCLSYSQAFGGTMGVGIFIDNVGDDSYNIPAAGVEAVFESRNFIQGSAKGRWAEATDGQSLSGGLGVFIDNSGEDKYFAGSFSQGSSYYFGLGLFYDKGGNDNYNALSHSQGYSAHYSLACFIDQTGDDSYNARSDYQKITQIIGSGRDFSSGLFLDIEGDDIYHFGNRSVGIGDINGIGVFADYKGNDIYAWHNNPVNSGSPSMGKSLNLDESMSTGYKVLNSPGPISKGIFYDNQGNNSIMEQ